MALALRILRREAVALIGPDGSDWDQAQALSRPSDAPV